MTDKDKAFILFKDDTNFVRSRHKKQERKSEETEEARTKKAKEEVEWTSDVRPRQRMGTSGL